jgi:hypothetical protein
MGRRGLKKAIVITSIFSPTEAVIKFSKFSDHKLFVVGDRKSPRRWYLENAVYISLEDQIRSRHSLAKILPVNHYCRKMLGYLSAIENGAESIIDTDDDNIPKEGYHFPPFEGLFNSVKESQGFVNIYQLFSKQRIWPRGLPLNMIRVDFELERKLHQRHLKVGIWQGLADEDPDVDAIYRLTSNEQCYFHQRAPITLGHFTVTPFNSQNTFVRKELFPLLYLPTYVTFRFTDILRGLVAQPIMWAHDYHLGFTNATVIQKRNPHDFMKDFLSELPMYQHVDKIVEVVSGVVSINYSIEDNLINAYEALLRKKIVESKELATLQCWLSDLSNC